MPPIPKAELTELRQRVSLVSMIGRTVKLTQQGADYFGLWPFHEEQTPSFTVNPSKGFFHCFGCGAHGDVIEWIMKTENVDFRSAIARLRIEAGHYSGTIDPIRLNNPQTYDDRKRRLALRFWEEAQPIGGTLAETYLREGRAISIDLPDSLRFHPDLRTEPGRDAKRLPALIAAISDPAGSVIAIQRTFLHPGGIRKANIDKAKRALGGRGNGAVRLANASRVTGIAEGVETGLSAMEMFSVPVWCALGSALSKVWLPPLAQSVVIFADRGDAGGKAANEAMKEFRAQGVIIPFLGGLFPRLHAACFSFIAGVIPPMPIFGRSLL